MRLSLEILSSREPSLLTQAGAVPTHRNGLACIGPAGVEEQGKGTSRVPRNLGDPAVSIVNCRLETPGDQLQAVRGRASGPVGDEHRDATMVPPSEGNEVRRDGRQGVGALS